MAQRKHDNPAQERYRAAKPPRFVLHHGRNLLRSLGKRTEHPVMQEWLKKNAVSIEQITR